MTEQAPQAHTSSDEQDDITEPLEPIVIHYGSSRLGLSFAYLLLLLALVSVFPALLAYAVAWLIQKKAHQEIWIYTHAQWIMRNSLIFLIIALFASLWFIPLCFKVWYFDIYTKTTTVIGAIFLLIAFLYLLNAWLKGIAKLLFKKSVF